MHTFNPIVAKLICTAVLIFPFQVLGGSEIEPNEEIFESVCRDYDIIGSSTKCENDLYEVEIPLIYKHELPRAKYINLNTDAIDLSYR